MKEAVVLAGGKGTRLKSVIEDVPKPMADINGRPFLAYQLDYLSDQGIKKVILAVGYKYKSIQDYFRNSFNGVEIDYCIEEKPLGTGGAIKKSLALCNTDNIFILNGDTYFDIDLGLFYDFHMSNNLMMTLALKPMVNFDRYGRVSTTNNVVTNFLEKTSCKSGMINGGIYIFNKELLKMLPKSNSFSFESDFMELKIDEIKIGAYVSDSYFIDIGIPDDYFKALADFKRYEKK